MNVAPEAIEQNLPMISLSASPNATLNLAAVMMPAVTNRLILKRFTMVITRIITVITDFYIRVINGVLNFGFKPCF